MDECFAFFLENFGPEIHRSQVPTERLAKYKGVLPEQMLAYWQEFGWCGYERGRFWTVDPDDYCEILSNCLDSTDLEKIDQYKVIARDAFGNMFAWGKSGGANLTINPYHGLLFWHPPSKYMEEGEADFCLRVFFSAQGTDLMDMYDDNKKKLFERALKKLGQLNYDELYGCKLALALGGRACLENLERQNIIEHLTILSQLDTFRVMENPLLKK